jgi:Response regulator containing a CheY-like receiver domain and an HTH DNA-binding domain
MNGSLDGFLSRLSAAQSVQETWNETVSFLKSLGFDLIEYGYAGVSSTGTMAEVATLSNFPAAYQERYRQERYYRDDPVVGYCIDNLPPLRVGRDSLGLWPDRGRGLTAIQRRIVSEAAECGMAVGVAIPLRSPGRYPLGGMSLSNAMRPAEFERFLADWGNIAQLAALYAHTRLQMLLQTPERPAASVVLSSREQECLLWVSRGLSSKEMAWRLGLSAKTVDFHVANAMGKLGVATRSHAVARAIALRLLEP